MRTGRSHDAASTLRIVVLGYVVRGPLGGLTSYQLQYLQGLMQLGHDVYFVEDSDDYPSCYDPSRDVTDRDPSYGLAFARRVFARCGLGERWAYYDAHESCWHGPCADHILAICEGADLVLNIGGVNPLRPWLQEVPARALVDQDPVFTQIRHETDAAARERALQHTSFLSVGENIVCPDTQIPSDGLPWQATRQPVVLDNWPLTPAPREGRFTTILLWDSYPAREFAGRRYGMKAESFDPYLELPARAGRRFELAVGSATAPLALLRDKGWSIRDSREPTRDPWTYQAYIQRSCAEWSVAKHGYVVSQSGWFSDRSLAYLASGRPALVQETGFSRWLESGSGVVPFATLDEALAGIEEITSRYELHCTAAREIAAEYFDASKVLERLLEDATRPARDLERLAVSPDARG
jgi:hypothetical protein